MAARGRLRTPGRAGTRYSKNVSGRTHSMKHEAHPKHKSVDVFDFPENSDVSNIGRLGENEKDEDPYETFDPPLHSTAIYADEEEFSKHYRSSVPSTPQEEGEESSENEARENESIKTKAKKPRRRQLISSESGSTEDEGQSEDEVRRKVLSTEKRAQPREAGPATASPAHLEKPAVSATPKRTGSRSAQSSAEDTRTTQKQPKMQKKGKVSPGQRKKSRAEGTDSDTSGNMHVWCLEGKRISDITELDIVLSAFEETVVEYTETIESKSCKEAVNKFYFNIKDELIGKLKEVQMLKNLKRKNAKIISNIERKRKRLIEVQDELLRLEPQLKRLQSEYGKLKEKKSSLKSSVHFLSNLKQLYQNYAAVQGKEGNIKETYDSSSLPALLFKARTILGAERHLQNINHQLGKLLEQE